MIDTGLPSTVDQLEEGIEEAGFEMKDVETVLVTHQDSDHAGGLSSVVSRTSPFVVAHELAAPVIDGREDTRGPDNQERYPPAHVDLELGGEASFNTCAGPAKVVPTPGHTPGHVSIYLSEDNFLIAADALTSESGRLYGPKPEMSEDMDEALSSVARLAELEIETTLCYHGGFVDAGSDRIGEIGEN